MAIEKTIMPPSEATEIAQAGFDSVHDILPMSKVFPMKSNEGLWVVDWTPVIPNQTTGRMHRRALDAEVGHTSSQTSTASAHTELIPLSGMDHITERDIARHPNDKEYIRSKAEDGFIGLGRKAAVTIELDCIDALMNGKLSVKDSGINVEADFQRPRNQHNQAPAGGKLWSDVTADVQTDVEEWVKVIRKNKGRIPHAVITTTKVIDALRLNENIRRELAQVTNLDYASPKLTRQQVIGYLATLGLTDVRMIDEIYENLELDNGFKMEVDTTTLIPDSTFVMFPSFNDPLLGFTADGPTAEGQDDEYGINKTVNDGLVGVLLSHTAPANYDLWVNGTALPILQEAVSTFKANVL
ncbi:major capsid protein [Bifidobacterium oedipodis]|uniref:Minor capsid protein E n=1 Tax=Bifidobacterium oedipodis TaxID=2675322 RepID=A0A7Y0EP62_9BIFI|nr:major capsid protein [Bifidobacterium sp. DSM 109957]NMM93875.1 minor capsid protein E [Bifidobacterium sp. DSM 109957]